MWPDPDKIYDSDDIINALWMDFIKALQRTKAVLVLGHSLNDRVLDAITRNVEPLERIGVTVLADANNPEKPDSSATNVLETIRTRLSNAGIIPLRFGATDEANSASGVAAIEKWVDGLSDKGFL